MRSESRRERIAQMARIEAERALILAESVVPAGDSEAVDGPHDGVMVALFPSTETARKLAVQGGEKANQLHVTLAYLGKAGALDGDAPTTLQTLVEDFAKRHGPLSGEISGVGYFKNPDGVVTYASVDLPDLPDFRQSLVDYLDAAGLPVSKDHGYTPHMTLAYEDLPGLRPNNEPLVFTAITVAVAGKRYSYDLTGPIGAEGAAVVSDPYDLVPDDEDPTEDKNRPQPAKPQDDTGENAMATGLLRLPQLQINPVNGGYQINMYDNVKPRSFSSLLTPTKPHPYEHPASPDTTVPGNLPNDLMGISPLVFPPCALCGMMFGDAVHTGNDGSGDPNAPTRQLQKAFLTEANGKTMLTAPASVWEKALSKNGHMMWMQGRFVGGETPNRNRAMWSTKDLELGQPTVAHGPLNWLHESRHIIGTIADARMVNGGGREAASTVDPHIVAMSAIWTWIYPDEAWVIENASDSGRLWYSMECISENVECVGDSGCGEKASYGEYMKGNGCRHMREKSAVRRFDNPTFLGGAVIVPPVRPGWADADARVLHSEAAALAERTFEEVHPDLSTSEWELMMGEVLKYATV